jgi:hypothetical protein
MMELMVMATSTQAAAHPMPTVPMRRLVPDAAGARSDSRILKPEERRTPERGKTIIVVEVLGQYFDF